MWDVTGIPGMRFVAQYQEFVKMVAITLYLLLAMNCFYWPSERVEAALLVFAYAVPPAVIAFSRIDALEDENFPEFDTYALSIEVIRFQYMQLMSASLILVLVLIMLTFRWFVR